MRHAFTIASVVYHAAFVACALVVLVRVRRRLSAGAWPGFTWGDATALGVATLALAALAAYFGLGTSLGFGWLRLLSQALFGEAVAVALALSVLHVRPPRSSRWAVAFAAVGAGLVGVYWEAYHREPRALQVSRHDVALMRSSFHSFSCGRFVRAAT